MWHSTGRLLPFSGKLPSGRVAKLSCSSANVASPTTMRQSTPGSSAYMWSLATPTSRAAVFGVSPIVEYCRRSELPMLQPIRSPE